MRSRAGRNSWPFFNAALDELRGAESERELAQKLEISQDVLARYRRGEFPKNIRRLVRFPELFEALALDATLAAEEGEPAAAAATQPGEG